MDKKKYWVKFKQEDTLKNMNKQKSHKSSDDIPDDLDRTIRKLERIRDLLKEIRELQKDTDIPFTPSITPLPYYPPQPDSSGTPFWWKFPPKIWC